MSRNPDTIANNPELLERVANRIELTTKKELLPQFIQWEIVEFLGFGEKYQIPFSKSHSVTYWQEKGGNQGYSDLVLVTKVYTRIADKFRSAFEPEYAASIDAKGADYLADEQPNFNALAETGKALWQSTGNLLSGVGDALSFVTRYKTPLIIGAVVIGVFYIISPQINLNLKKS